MKKSNIVLLILSLISIALGYVFIFAFRTENFGNMTDATEIIGISMVMIGFILLVVLFVKFIIWWIKLPPSNKNNASSNSTTTKQEPKREIKLVKILGTRTALETKVFARYNFTIYSILIVFKDGGRQVVEVQSNTPLFNELIKYIKVDNNKPITMSEMIEFDEMDE